MFQVALATLEAWADPVSKVSLVNQEWPVTAVNPVTPASVDRQDPRAASVQRAHSVSLVLPDHEVLQEVPELLGHPDRGEVPVKWEAKVLLDRRVCLVN